MNYNINKQQICLTYPYLQRIKLIMVNYTVPGDEIHSFAQHKILLKLLLERTEHRIMEIQFNNARNSVLGLKRLRGKCFWKLKIV